MSFEDWRRERAVRRVLSALARQRVVIIAPGAPWVIERAVPDFDGAEEALRTCELRGWAEIVHADIPHKHLSTEDLMHPTGENLAFNETADIFRLTEAGWAAVNRTHAWLLATFTITTASLVAAIIGAMLTWYQIAQKLP